MSICADCAILKKARNKKFGRVLKPLDVKIGLNENRTQEKKKN